MKKLSIIYDKVINLYAHTKVGYNRPSLASSFISIRKYDPMFMIAPDKNSISEGSEIKFDVSAFNVKNGTVVYYTITGCSASDFTDDSLTGSCVITNNAGSFTKTLKSDSTTEGIENFRVNLKTSANGRVIKYTNLIPVADTSLAPVYAVTATPTTTNESGSVTFNWSVTNSIGAVLTWELTGVSAEDFTDGLGLSGSLTGMSGSVTKVLAADQTVEGLETALFVLKADGGSVATCTCEVADSSAREYVDDVFSTYLYTGNGSTQTINNGIDLAGKGGLVWTKARAGTYSHMLNDNLRTTSLNTESTAAQGNYGNAISAFTSTGYALTSQIQGNHNASPFVSWTFRKAPKFFDVVTYTGNATAGRQIPHNLGCEPGLIIAKLTDSVASWFVYHRSLGAGGYLELNTTAAFVNLESLWNASPTSTYFRLGTSGGANADGRTYIAYLFAHDPSPEGLIQCGSYIGNTYSEVSVTLGWEPQYLLIKRVTNANDPYRGWGIFDISRGIIVGGNDNTLLAHTADAENGTYSTGDFLYPTATGFTLKPSMNLVSTNDDTYIFMAIRRSNKPPADATKVYNAIARTGTGAAATVTGVGFAPDMVIPFYRGSSMNKALLDRLRGPHKILQPSTASADIDDWTDAEVITSFNTDGITLGKDNGFSTINSAGAVYVINFFKRTPGFFDIVCYTGTGVARTVNHNLGVVPELMIVKCRSNAGDWYVSSQFDVAVYNYGYLNGANAFSSASYGGGVGINELPSSTVVNITGSGSNGSGYTFVAYLFASLPGISKVGSYTGNGSSQSINCSFTAGSRFLLIKRTDSTGDWYLWDSVRGIVAGNDPHLSLNTTDAEVTSDDSVDYSASGFTVNQVTATNINVNNATYIYLAIA